MRIPEDIETITRAFVLFSCGQDEVYERITCDPSFARIQGQMTEGVLASRSFDKTAFGGVPEGEASLLVTFVQTVPLTLYRRWVADGKLVLPERLADIACALVLGGVRGVPRDEAWITSKLWPSEYGEGKTAEAIDKTLDRLGTYYIDLLLLHQQFGDYLGAWRDMERAVAAGKVRSIGLSNFESGRLEEALDAATIKPSVMQVECHPCYQQGELKKRLASYGTVLEAWYPLGHGDAGLLAEPLFTELGEKYDKSPAQVILRWHIQEGTIVFPKTTNPAHMVDIIDIFDFELTDDEMARVRALDCGRRYFTLGLEEQEASLSAFVPAD